MQGGCSDAALTVLAIPVTVAVIWWIPSIGWILLGLIVLFVIAMVREGPPTPEQLEAERRRLRRRYGRR